MFDLIRGHKPSATAVHCAFALLKLDGEDLRLQPIEIRRALLADLLHATHSTIVVNEQYEGDGENSSTPALSVDNRFGVRAVGCSFRLE